MRQEASATFRASEIGEPFKPRQLTVSTLVSLMSSPALLQRVGEQVQMSPRAVSAGLVIAPARNTDLINISFATSRSPESALRVVNAFGQEVIRFTRDLQIEEAGMMNKLLKQQLSKTEDDLQRVNSELLEYSQQSGLINSDKEMDAYLRSLGDLDLRYETIRIEHETIDLKIKALEQELARNNPLTDRLRAARDRLSDLLQQYTDANPLVKEQRQAIASLEVSMQAQLNQPPAPPRPGESTVAANFYSELMNLRAQKEIDAVQAEKLQAVRAELEKKLQKLPEKEMQLARIKAHQKALEASQALLASRQREAQLYTESAQGYYQFFASSIDDVEKVDRVKYLIILVVGGGMFGVLLAIVFFGVRELLDDRLKTPADLKRVTGLPLLAALPDLGTLDAVAQSHWAFRTWLGLQTRLVENDRQQTICGFLAMSRHEGCSTWLELLAHGAAQRGEAVLVVTNHSPRNGNVLPLAEALSSPSLVSFESGRPQWLLAPADWQWNAANRHQWEDALKKWSGVNRLAVLVELGNSDSPETLIMSEKLPQLVLLARSGNVAMRTISERLQMYRHGGCRFVGAVLNQETKLFF